MVFGTGGENKYFRSRGAVEGTLADLAAELAPAIDILRGRFAGQPPRTVLVSPRHLSEPTITVALFQNFLGRPAMVAAVAVGEQENPANANARAPIVALVKYVSDRLLTKIADHLHVEDLRLIDAATPSRDDQIVTLARGATGCPLGVAAKAAGRRRDCQLRTVRCGGAYCLRAADRHHHAPYAAHGRRDCRRRAAIAPPRAARSGLRIPNRIYLSERLERAITEVRNGGPTAAVFYIDLDHFKDVNDTLGHHMVTSSFSMSRDA